jgi:YVTN family beta-propeller protein
MRSRYASTMLVTMLVIVLCATGCDKKLKTIETDADPSSLALDARGQYLYVACEGAEKIMVWDIRKKAKIGEANVETGPLRLYLQKDNRTLFVLCQTDRVVYKFHVPDMKFLESFLLPDGPTAFWAYEDKNQMFFSSSESNLLRPYVGKNPLPSIEVGIDPLDIKHQPSTDFLWVANHKASTLNVVNLESNEVVKTVPVWANPRRLVVSPLEDKMFVLCTGQDAEPAVSVIQLVDFFYQTAGLTWQAGKDVRDFVLGPRGRNLYVIDEECLMVLSVKTGVKLLEQKTGKNPQAVVVSPDGSRVYVSAQEEQAVVIHKLKADDLIEK